jgi:hypothetical protein
MTELPANLSRCQRGQISMVICVIADGAALGPDLRRRTRILDLAEAQLEEGRCGVGCPQDVEDGRRVLAGSVIEGQVHDAAMVRRRPICALPRS